MLKLPQSKDLYQLKEVKVGTTWIAFSSSFVQGRDVEIRFALADEAIEEPGESHQGDYVVWLKAVVRDDQGWRLKGRMVSVRSTGDPGGNL